MDGEQVISKDDLERNLTLFRAELGAVQEEIESLERRQVNLKEQVIAARAAVEAWSMGHSYAIAERAVADDLQARIDAAAEEESNKAA